MSDFYGSTYDRYIQRTDDSKAHKLKNVYWTTKQAMIKKFGRKQDENLVASDADLDSKLELLKSVQITCRDLTRLLTRYQDTICYLSQSENEMGRFLKRYSLEDKSQAGKIMSAAGKALSHSAQQRLNLRAPMDRVSQEVKTFRHRTISDTVHTLKRMEATRTQYRGALLWMKNVSEELDPDTYKQMEKFRCVQAQVRKSKTEFDRLKIDSMQKIDLLSASRCNMLSHALVAYQNSLLTFLETTSRTMVAVADRFRGYQYYEFSILKHLRPESKKLAGLEADDDSIGEASLVSHSDDDDRGASDSSGVGCPHTPPPERRRHSDAYSPIATADLLGISSQRVVRSTGPIEDVRDHQNGERASGTITGETASCTEEELDRRLEEIFRADHVGEGTLDDLFDLGINHSPPFGNITPMASTDHEPFDSNSGDTQLLSATDGPTVPTEHRDILADLFDGDGELMLPSSSTLNQDIGRQSEATAGSQFESEWASMMQFSSMRNSTPANQPSVTEDDPWQEFRSSSALPSHLLDERDWKKDSSVTSSMDVGDINNTSSGAISQHSMKGPVPPVLSNQASTSSSRTPNASNKKTNLDDWMGLFADLGSIGDPDAICKKEGQITDA